MGRIEKTVFISYRRSSGSGWALAISQNLTHHGYDVFFDYLGIASGDFERVILENIKARAHFLVLLTPSALERVDAPGDWLRREIETALTNQRNIVPLMLEGFDFSAPSITGRLTGTLEPLRRYNGLTVPPEYFDEAMTRLRTRHLNVPINAVLRPPSFVAEAAASAQRVAVASASVQPVQELTADQWFERGFGASDPDESLRFFTEVIRVKPDYAFAYYNRGIALRHMGDLDGAIRDFDEAIRLDPNDADAYNNRGDARRGKGDLNGAIRDLDEAIRLKPDYAAAYNNRGLARRDRKDLAGALRDYDEAIRLKPDFAEVYYNRALIREQQSARLAAVSDYRKYLELGGGVRDGDQAEVEEWIQWLRQAN
jgi:tetratricopeptide (TPR) repeat protein